MKLASTRAAAALCALMVLAGSHSGCASKKKLKKEQELAGLTSTAMYERAMEFLSRGKLRQARELLERIQFEYDPDRRQDLEPLVRLAIADATFYQPGDLSLIDARSLYLDFVTLFGDHSLAPYAQLQAGLCSVKGVSHPSKDQSRTHQAVTDLSEVVRRYPESRYAGAAKSLLATARTNLAESEYLIGRFYLTRKAYEAAAERFRIVLTKYPEFGEKPKVLYYLAQALRLGENDAEARLYLDQLIADYPQDPYAKQAGKTLTLLEPSPASDAQEPSR